MAYGTSKANLRQTSANVAATLTAAFASAGLVKDTATAVQFFKDTRDEVFTDLEAQPTEVPGGGGKAKTWSGRKGGGGGGGSQGGDPGATVLNYGKFAGQTIAQVYDMDKQATSEYGYEKDGKAYIAWLTKNDNNKFLKDKANAFVEAKRAGAGSSDAAVSVDSAPASSGEDW